MFTRILMAFRKPIIIQTKSVLIEDNTRIEEERRLTKALGRKVVILKVGLGKCEMLNHE